MYVSWQYVNALHSTPWCISGWEESCYVLSRNDVWREIVLAWVQISDCPPLQAILLAGCFKDLKNSFWLDFQGKAEAVRRAGKTGERLQWIDDGCQVCISSKRITSPDVVPICFALRWICEKSVALHNRILLPWSLNDASPADAIRLIQLSWVITNKSEPGLVLCWITTNLPRSWVLMHVYLL